MIVAKNATESIELAVKELTSDNVVVLPTDTVYGFSGIVPCTENKIREIKGRDETKPFIRLISEPDEIYRYTEDIVPKELIDMWPGALTVIVTLKKELSLFEGETVGFRCPGDEWLRTVISKCGYPVFSSSVNKSGCPLLNTVEEINAEFGDKIPLIISNLENENKESKPSTIVKVVNGKCQVIRQGDVIIPGNIIA